MQRAPRNHFLNRFHTAAFERVTNLRWEFGNDGVDLDRGAYDAERLLTGPGESVAQERTQNRRFLLFRE